MARTQGPDYRLVLQAVEDHIADTGKLPSTPEIIARVEISDKLTRTALDRLVQQGKLVAVYEAPKNPTIYMPGFMYEAVLRKQRRPDWIGKYTFKDAEKIESEIHERYEQLQEYHLVESLLFATGRGLEEAVGAAFRELELEDVQTPYEDADSWDVSFVHEGCIYIMDVKGKSKWADKDDVAQLQQWLMRYVDKHPDADPNDVRGALIINHFKDLDPEERWPTRRDRAPLSEAGERYLKLGNKMFITTADIFDVTSRVLQGETTKEQARKHLITRFRKELKP